MGAYLGNEAVVAPPEKLEHGPLGLSHWQIDAPS